MISQPYERVFLNTQDGVKDCGEAPTYIFGSGGDNLFIATGDTGEMVFLDSQMSTVLRIDVDKEGVVPMVVKEQGYEWTPVYTRKLT